MTRELDPMDPSFDDECRINPTDRLYTPYDLYPQIAMRIVFPDLPAKSIAVLVTHLKTKAELVIKSEIRVTKNPSGTHNISLGNTKRVAAELKRTSYGVDNVLLRGNN